MEMNIMYWIQSLRNPGLDNFFVTFSNIVGSKGELWVILGMVLLIIPKTRKAGLCVLSSYIISYYIGDGILKDMIARPRPCHIDETVALLISRPTSYSCPSVHSALSFASAMSIFYRHKGLGSLFIVVAIVVCFSRMYLFVHFLTDVLFGALLGALVASLVYLLTKHI